MVKKYNVGDELYYVNPKNDLVACTIDRVDETGVWVNNEGYYEFPDLAWLLETPTEAIQRCIDMKQAYMELQMEKIATQHLEVAQLRVLLSEYEDKS